jgi:uncharacterized Zn finger protein
MARSTPHRRLYCSHCKKRDLHNVLVQEIHTGYYDPTWFGVEVIGEASHGKAQCKCLSCGHVWVSDSMAAKRELRSLVRQQEINANRHVAVA